MQLSQALPTRSESLSVCEAFGTASQLSQALRTPSLSVSTPCASSSNCPEQLSSMPLHASTAFGRMFGLASLQSFWQTRNPSPSASSSFAGTAGQLASLQVLLARAHNWGAPG